MWTGIEPTWRRTQHAGTERRQVTSDVEQIAARIERAASRPQGRPPALAGAVQDESPRQPEIRLLAGEQNPLRSTRLPGEVVLEGSQDWKSQASRNWLEQAQRMAGLLERTAPALYRAPEIQFPLAALHRQRKSQTESNAVYHNLLRTGGEGPWKKSAQMELWIANPVELPPKSLQTCRRTDERPVLDGIFSDPCWQSADEMPLLSDLEVRPDAANHAFALLSYDEEYLYFAGSFPRVPDTPADLPSTKGRQHDADLSRFDRVELLLDVDRDYVTYYRFAVDQRGWTAEDCWEDATWNPRWFVAADGDAASWRVEAAIPWKELVPGAPRKNTVWGARVVRTIPAVGVQSWTHPASSHPRLETAGALRFD
jgi:hypothetical protein